MTILSGIIFAARVIHTRGVTLMESSKEKNGGLSSKRLTQEQIGNDAYMTPAAIESEENLKARICDLKPHINQQEKSLGLKEGYQERLRE